MPNGQPAHRASTYPAAEVAAIIRDATRRTGKTRRHPAQVIIDQLGNATQRWGDQFTGAELDAIGQTIAALQDIAEGKRARG